MLDLSDPLFIRSFFLLFISSIALGQAGVPLGLCVWIEHPYVEKCTLPISSPEALHHDIYSGSLFPVGCSVSQMFPGHRLETWFSTYSMTYFAH